MSKRSLTSTARLFAVIFIISGVIAPHGALQRATTPARAEEADRIVAIGGAITETLYALGLGGSIVGVDTTSLYPADALKTKPNIGYFRAFSAEGVLSLKPSLIIAAQGAGPLDAIKLLRDSGVALTRLSDDFSPEGVVKKIDAIGHLTHAEAKATQVAQSVTDGFRELGKLRSRVSGKTRVLFVLAMQGGHPLVAGSGTAADAMITLAGGINAADGFTGYKPMNDEAIIVAAPDVIVMMGNSKDQSSPDDIFALPGFATTPAAMHHRLVAMDGLYLLGFGPRTPQAAKQLLLAFYPTLAASTANGHKP